MRRSVVKIDAEDAAGQISVQQYYAELEAEMLPAHSSRTGSLSDLEESSPFEDDHFEE